MLRFWHWVWPWKARHWLIGSACHSTKKRERQCQTCTRLWWLNGNGTEQENRYDWIQQMLLRTSLGTGQTLYQVTKLIPARLRGTPNMPESLPFSHLITFKWEVPTFQVIRVFLQSLNHQSIPPPPYLPWIFGQYISFMLHQKSSPWKAEKEIRKNRAWIWQLLFSIW